MNLLNRYRSQSASEREQGLTLVELLVAMVVGSIVVTLVASVTIQAFRIQRDTTVRERDSTAAALAMETLSRDVRQAVDVQQTDATGIQTTTNAFSTANPTSLTVISWIAADPVKVTYVLRSNGNLERTVQKPDVANQTTSSVFTSGRPSTTSVLARSVTSKTLFSYVLKTGENATSYTGDDLDDIRSVVITLTVDSDTTDRLPGTTLSNAVVCLNL